MWLGICISVHALFLWSCCHLCEQPLEVKVFLCSERRLHRAWDCRAQWINSPFLACTRGSCAHLESWQGSSKASYSLRHSVKTPCTRRPHPRQTSSRFHSHLRQKPRSFASRLCQAWLRMPRFVGETHSDLFLLVRLHTWLTRAVSQQASVKAARQDGFQVLTRCPSFMFVVKSYFTS